METVRKNQMEMLWLQIVNEIKNEDSQDFFAIKICFKRHKDCQCHSSKMCRNEKPTVGFSSHSSNLNDYVMVLHTV